MFLTALHRRRKTIAVISIPRGTTAYITITPKDLNGNAYKLKTGERILFGVKELPTPSAPYLIFKELTETDEYNGSYTCIIMSEETNIAPKRYYYDCGAELEDGSYQIIAKCAHFVITDSVTYKGDKK